MWLKLPPVVIPKFLSENELKTFMTRDERISYKEAATDPVVADFQEMLALGPVDLADAGHHQRHRQARRTRRADRSTRH